MNGRLIPKKRPSDVEKHRLTEPALNTRGLQCVTRGTELFNRGKFWEAHEVWEEAWRGCEEESRIFFQGIIQVAAGYHLLFERPRPAGARRNFQKALEKLELFPGEFLGFNVAKIRAAVNEALECLGKRGSSPADIPAPFIDRRTAQ
ncbi:MAG: hypothetical protein HBSIN02_03140 [Bacteroidia bacterium]|nr:MAG: hypothetical protein HBSIN02_03140 [Bacteroidia bacterium]